MSVKIDGVTTADHDDRKRMGRRKKDRITKPVRLYEDTAETAADFADLFGEDVADFLDPPIRAFLEQRRAEALRKIEEKKQRYSKKPKTPKEES